MILFTIRKLLVCFRMTDRCKIVKSIIEGLNILGKSSFDSKSDFAKITSAAEDLLYAVFIAGASNTAFTSEEKRTIGPLVLPALQGLGYNLSILQSSFSSLSVDSVRIQRSGLQFLIDKFSEFPASSDEKPESLEDTLKEFFEREDVDGLDERLKTVEFDCYSDDSKRTPSLQEKIEKLPSTHWWFSE